jgi:hypothetical protein
MSDIVRSRMRVMSKLSCKNSYTEFRSLGQRNRS